MIKYFFAVAALSLSACSSNNMGISKDYNLNNSRGVVFLSVRSDPITECDRPAPFFVAIHKEGETIGQLLNVENFLIETDFKNPDGYFYSLELDQGKHYIRDDDLHYKLKGVEKRVQLEFNVTLNKATYIGEITFRREHMNRTKHDCSVVHVNRTNKYNRDLSILIERAVNISPNDVIRDLAKATFLK